VLLLVCTLYCAEMTDKKIETQQNNDTSAKISQLEAKLAALTSQLNSVSPTARYAPDGANLFNYMYREAQIYQDIFGCLNSNIISPLSTVANSRVPTGWDDTSYSQTLWNNRRILRIGTANQVQSNGNGLLVNIPSGYDVLWIRVLNERWTTFRVAYTSAQANFAQDVNEVYAAGYRKLNGIAPDGAGPDSQWDLHQWFPIPIRQQGSLTLYTDKNSDPWISGIAFGKNLWNHAMNSAVAFLWKLNPADGEITWVGENWNNDQLAKFEQNSNTEVSVPVVFSGKDKLVYLVEHNNNWVGVQHGRVYVNGQEVERLRTTYRNPFATHFNSKFYNRYIATRIPANLIQQGDRFIKLRIDMTPCNHHIHFREIGTHDYF